MKTAWKVLLGLVLVVPLGAYVAGSLAASASDDPAPRHTIQINEPGPTPTKTPTKLPSRTPSSQVSETPDDEVEVITPEYDDLHDDHGGDDHGGGDNSGHGGGGDDDSGHGGGNDG